MNRNAYFHRRAVFFKNYSDDNYSLEVILVNKNPVIAYELHSACKG